MSSNTSSEGNSPEDNKLIRGLREQIENLTAAVETAGTDAVAKVKRVSQASTLMPEGFKGLSDIFETEVDGELTVDSAAEWLKGRGFTASSDTVEAETATKAAALEEVTNLGGAVAAAGNLAPEDAAVAAIGEIDINAPGQTLQGVTEAVDAILNPVEG